MALTRDFKDTIKELSKTGLHETRLFVKNYLRRALNVF